MASAVIGVRIHACGLSAATWLKAAHSAATRSRCSSMLMPSAARSATSNIGYTCTGMTMPRASSAGPTRFSSSPMDMAGATSSDWELQPRSVSVLRASLRVRHASPPVSSTRSLRPSTMSSAVRLTSVWT